MVQEAVVTQPAEVAAAAPGAVQPPSRRDRLRAATIDEIIQTARQLLVKDGPEAVSLRAIAREMGMTAPGLYRYFGRARGRSCPRSEEHTSELQSQSNLVCRLLLEKQ